MRQRRRNISDIIKNRGNYEWKKFRLFRLLGHQNDFIGQICFAFLPGYENDAVCLKKLQADSFLMIIIAMLLKLFAPIAVQLNKASAVPNQQDA
ncbi:MAG: hypothetical protein A2X49_04300 [Lentisphaerae bacterium GWF2_52_8]|nr:MAG: hypothetical protein A2X49_04300 [Lentisphaerae bacterium GWF2_52_8]